MSSPKNNRLLTWIILLASFSAAGWLLYYIARHQVEVTNFIKNLGAAGPLASIAMYILLAFSPVPADPLSLINGAIYGPVWGGLLAWIGMTAAALMEFFIGQRIGESVDFEENRQDLPFGLGNLPVNSIAFLLGGRLLTGAGSKIVSYLSGIYRISLGRYLWTTALSTLFGAILFAFGGAGLLKLLG